MAKNRSEVHDLDWWLDYVSVTLRDQCDLDVVGKWWPESHPWSVGTGDEGEIALFMHETDACRFRLDYINRKMNP